MGFNLNSIRVFDKSGAPIGELPTWEVAQPRSYRLNEVEDFAFTVPRKDILTNTVIITADVYNILLRRDNLIYIANQDPTMRGWAGQITRVSYGGGKAAVKVTGLFGLFLNLETERLEQDEGYVWTIAQRLVLAAQSKQAAAGDFIIDFEHDETPGEERRNFGSYTYEGDIGAGLQTLAGNNLAEFFVHAIIDDDGHLRAKLRWGGRFHIDHRDLVLKDGEDGNILPGSAIDFTSGSMVNRARLRGTPTSLRDYVDYDSVRNVLRDVVPECELDLDPGPYVRRREQLGLTVGFGYDEATQRSMAQQVQGVYLGYYKSFVYAFHAEMGRPYLEGYDWPGPDGRNDKKLTAHFFRSIRKMGYVGQRTILTGSTDDDDESFIEAEFNDWQFRQTLTPGITTSGVATDPSDPNQKFLADAATGNVYELEDDRVTMNLLFHATTGVEVLQSVATDPTRPNNVWVLCVTGSGATVKMFGSTGTLVSQWTVAGLDANDITVDAPNGIVWIVSNGETDVQAYDISSGTEVVAGSFYSFDSGFASPAGLSTSGGLAYVIDAAGEVRFLFTEDGGDFAGTMTTGTTAAGLLVDLDGGEVWVVRPSGNIDIYRAHIAVATINAPGSVEGAPGFDEIQAGQFVHVVMQSDKAASPHPRNKYLIVYAKGRYITTTVEGGPGEPDVLQRTWVTDAQKHAVVKMSKVRDPGDELIVQGEESRVDDWDPKEDGYGIYGTYLNRTARGHILRAGPRWHFRDWDIPPREFEIDPPEWTTGLGYLQDWLARQNADRPVQVLRVNNKGNLFPRLVLGGEYTVQKSLDGPPDGITGVLRLLAYTPDEGQGNAELIGEWVA